MKDLTTQEAGASLHWLPLSLSKLVEVVTVADVDVEKRVENVKHEDSVSQCH